MNIENFNIDFEEMHNEMFQRMSKNIESELRHQISEYCATDKIKSSHDFTQDMVGIHMAITISNLSKFITYMLEDYHNKLIEILKNTHHCD